MAKILDRLQKPVACTNLGNGLVLASNNENRPDLGLYSMLSSIMRQWVNRTIRWRIRFYCITSRQERFQEYNIMSSRKSTLQVQLMYLFFSFTQAANDVKLSTRYPFLHVLLLKACGNEGKGSQYFYFFLFFLPLHPLNSPLPLLL